jgi:hypothetical protein|tara:strand:- start:817 stop:1002 length:186 start_codon:yes stop_codon:yes gene_type:complete
MVSNLSSARCTASAVKGSAAALSGKAVWATGASVSIEGELGGTELHPAIIKTQVQSGRNIK